MQLRILALAAALIGAVSVPPASAQNQGKRDLLSPCENTTLILLAIEISVPWRSVLPGR